MLTIHHMIGDHAMTIPLEKGSDLANNTRSEERYHRGSPRKTSDTVRFSDFFGDKEDEILQAPRWNFKIPSSRVSLGYHPSLAIQGGN